MLIKWVNSIFPTSIRRPILSRTPRVQLWFKKKIDSALYFVIVNRRARAVVALFMVAIERSGHTYDENSAEWYYATADPAV